MGALPFIKTHFEELNFSAVCRPESGSPASGLLEVHKLRQQKILDRIFKRCNCENSDIYCTMSCTKDIFSNKLVLVAEIRSLFLALDSKIVLKQWSFGNKTGQI